VSAFQTVCGTKQSFSTSLNYFTMKLNFEPKQSVHQSAAGTHFFVSFSSPAMCTNALAENLIKLKKSFIKQIVAAFRTRKKRFLAN
jgi:hypothetical protein